MSYNGSGIWTAPSSVFPLVNGTLADADQVDAIITDIGVGLSTALCRDGQSTVIGNLPMSGFKLTGLGSGTSRTDAATVGNVQDGTGIFVNVIGGTANAVTLAPSPAIASYTIGQRFRFIPIALNTGVVTVQISGLASKPLRISPTQELIAGDLTVGRIVDITYDGTQFLLSGLGAQTPLTQQVLIAPVLSGGLVVADPTAPLGVASKQYVDALWTTGDVKLTFKAVADAGWVMMNDATIGSASSAATARANADTQALYMLLWNNVSNTYAPVAGGRGATAAADFAADKELTLCKVLGRSLAVAGAGATLTSRSLGETLGEETHTMTTGELVAHTHTVGDDGTTGSLTGVAVGTHLNPGSSGSTGSSTPFNVMQPTTFLNVMIKL